MLTELKPKRFIETGTHIGFTAHWVATNFPDVEVHTVEVDPDFYARGHENLSDLPNVQHYLGDSREMLQELLPKIREGLNVFWLDAHWFPPVPLQEECAIVNQLDSFVCLVDDFACWDPWFGGDTFYSRPCADYSIPGAGGPAYYNDLSYTRAHISGVHFRPCYTPEHKPNPQGIGMYVKGLSYAPPIGLMRHETLGVPWLEARTVGGALYPPHPSAKDWLP